MARLIDADALLEQYSLKDATKYGNKDAEQQAHSYGTMMLYEIADMIESAPTAYDTDKVVQQIKSLSPANYVSKDDVLKIVKGGGIDGKEQSQ